jgi:simple sugar transport system permease protein
MEALLEAGLRLAAPLLLAALGELVVERSGVVNIGIEGTMLTGAFAGFAVAVASGSPSCAAPTRSWWAWR